MTQRKNIIQPTEVWAALGVAVYSADVFDTSQFWIEDLRSGAGGQRQK
jgi:hypothetical protein